MKSKVKEMYVNGERDTGILFIGTSDYKRSKISKNNPSPQKK